MPTIVTTDEAEAHIRDLLARVEHGEEVVIERDGHPIARLAPNAEGPGAPSAGRASHFGWAREVFGPLNDDWDEPLDEEDLGEFFDDSKSHRDAS